MTATLDLFTGFEHGTLSWFDSYEGTMSVIAGAKRNGNYGYRLQSHGGYAVKLLPVSGNEFYFRVGCRVGSTSGTAYGQIQFLEVGTKHLGIGWFDTGAGLVWVVYRNVTNIASGGALALSTFYCLEGYIKIADVNGRAVVKADSVTVIDFTGDTQNGATGTCDRFMFYQNGSYITDWDDLAIARNDWIGNGRAVDKAPNGAGDSTQLSIAGGDPTNWQAIDNRPPDPAHYVYGSTLNLYDLYALASSGLTAGAIINAIQPWAFAILNQAGAGNLAVGIKGAAGEDWSSDIVLPSDSWKYVNKVYATKPVGWGGGAWTQALLDTLQAGVKVR